MIVIITIKKNNNKVMIRVNKEANDNTITIPMTSMIMIIIVKI